MLLWFASCARRLRTGWLSSLLTSKSSVSLSTKGRERSTMITLTPCRHVTQRTAIDIDKELFEEYKFSVDQLMELAGQSCAIAIAKCYPLLDGHLTRRVLVFCGPGNNGGDGLVCARHLKHFGYLPEIYYPKRTNNELYQRLLHQCIKNDIKLLEDQWIELATDTLNTREYAFIVDALFGFSFKPPIRKPFVRIIDLLKSTTVPICSIDVPSGWHVENGPLEEDDIRPQLLISLTVPKMCAWQFKGMFHYLGGRFVPKELESKYDLRLPEYIGTSLVVRLK